jgi:hypothetical protein
MDEAEFREALWERVDALTDGTNTYGTCLRLIAEKQDRAQETLDAILAAVTRGVEEDGLVTLLRGLAEGVAALADIVAANTEVLNGIAAQLSEGR